MTDDIGDMSQRRAARIAGLLYLLYIATFASSSFVQGKPIVNGDAAATARNLMASDWLFRIGITSELLAALLFLLTAWALYELLKSVNRGLALLFVLLNLGGVAVECVSTLIRFDALLPLSGANYLKALGTDQLQALSMLLLNLGNSGNMVSVLFYGAWLFPLGYLVVKSSMIPRNPGHTADCRWHLPLGLLLPAMALPGPRKTYLPVIPSHVHCGVWICIVAAHQGRQGQGAGFSLGPEAQDDPQISVCGRRRRWNGSSWARSCVLPRSFGAHLRSF